METYRQVVHTGTGLQKTVAEYCKDKDIKSRMRLTGQAHGTHKSNVDDILVAKTSSTKVNFILRRDGEDISN